VTDGTLIALHTSDPVGSVAIARGTAIVSAEFSSAGRHAPVVLNEILRLLETNAVRLDDCDGIAVTTGPGSFTGIRIGLATVLGLAAARRWPVHAAGSLPATAAACARGPEPLAVVFDARRGEVYAGMYDVSTGIPRELTAPFCAPVAAAAVRLVGVVPASQLRLTGSGAALVGAQSALAGATHVEPARTTAAALCDLVRSGVARAVAARDLEPMYLRESDAELRRDPAARRDP